MPVTIDKLLGIPLLHKHKDGDISDFSVLDARYLNLTGGVMTGNILMSSNRLIGGSTTTSDLYLQTTTGVGTTGADMHFLVGNNGATEAMTILNNGNVGIGTTAPGAKLEINGNTTSGWLKLTTTSGNPVIESAAGLVLKAGGFTAMYTDGNSFGLGNVTGVYGDVNIRSGNVGIGTMAPQHTLQTYGTLKVGGAAGQATGTIALGDDLSTQLNVGMYRGTTAGAVGGGNSLILASYDDMLFTSSAAQFGSQTVRMFIDNISGNVGIGTTAPTNKLDINDDSIRVRTSLTPATAGATGNQGEIAWDSSYIYVCTATNTWVRASLATW